MTGLFITFEGIDGCGKSTQAKIFANWLKRQGLPVVTTREPGGTPLAERIRGVLLEPIDEEVAPLTEILLYAASRAQHVEEQIRPALESGAIVVCERFTDSSMAYQGYGLGYDLKLIKDINQTASAGLCPHWTILVDLSPEEACQRVSRRTEGEDRIEARGLLFQSRVRQGYLALARENANRVTIFDGNRKELRFMQREIRREFKCRFPILNT
jgi:dTMP kinase